MSFPIPGGVSVTQTQETQEHQLHYNISNKISRVQLYEVVNTKNIVIVTRELYDATKVPSVLFPIRSVDIHEYPLLYDLKLINTFDIPDYVDLRTINIEMQTKPMIVRTIKPGITSVSSIEDLFFCETYAYELHSLFLSIELLMKFGTQILNQPTMKQGGTSTAYKYFDVSSFKNRNIVEMFNQIRNTSTRVMYLDMLDRKYREEDSKTMDQTYKEALDINDNSVQNYTLSKLPLFLEEVKFHQVAFQLLKAQYMSSQTALRFAEMYNTINCTVSPHEIAKYIRADLNIRYPIPLLNTINIELAYKIPAAMEELRSNISGMANPALRLSNLSDAMNQLKMSIGLNTNKTEVGEEIFHFLQDFAIGEILHAMHISNINPNLYRFEYAITYGHALNSSVFNNYYCALSILVTQLLFPYTVFSEHTLIMINNALCRFIFQYKLRPITITKLQEYCVDRKMMPFPTPADEMLWNSTTDYLYHLYVECSSILLGTKTPDVIHTLILLRNYYHNLEPVQMKNKCGKEEKPGLYLPYQYGLKDYSTIADRRYNMVRQKLKLHLGGAMRLDIDPNGNIDASFFKKEFEYKMMVLREIITHLTQPTGYSNSSQIDNIQKRMENVGHSNFIALIKNYHYYTTKYSMSAGADLAFRTPSESNKRIVALPFFSALTLLVRVAGEQENIMPLHPTFLDGTSTLKIMTIFHALYHIVSSRVNRMNITLLESSILEIAENLTRKIIGNDSFSAKAEFGYNTANEYEWKQYLAISPNETIESVNPFITLLNRYLPIIPNYNLYSGLVPGFYLVKRALSGPHAKTDLPLVAANTVMTSQLDVKHIIRSYDEYIRLISLVNHLHGSYDNRMQTMFYELKENTVQEFMDKKKAIKVEAIKVEIPAYVDLTISYENGNFTPKHIKGMKYLEFVDNFEWRKEQTNHYLNLPKLLRIPMTIMLNDIGSKEHLVPASQLLKDEYFKCFGDSQVIVPLESFPIEVMTIDSFMESCNTSVVSRKTGFDIKSSFDIEFVATNNLRGVE